jgi:phosphatidylinositol alpha-1,6-mannosyltransferase
MVEFLFLASGLGGLNHGGIQSSAQIAWDAVRSHCRRHGGKAALLSYGEESARTDEAGVRVICARRRHEIVAQALWRRWRARHVLVWHLGLAQLLPLLRTGDARVSVFLHGIEAWRPLGAVPAWCLRRVDQFLVNSRFTWQRFVAANPRFATVPHCVTPLGIGEPCLDPTPEPAGPPVALMLGRLIRAEAYKGHHETIAAWPEVCARVPGAQLWIVGDGDLRPDLEAYARARGCGDSVVFWGRVPEPKKRELLARCRCLALPSRAEGFGLVYLEAMRLGRPCLVSNQDAGREVVHPPEAGLEVDPSDPAAVAASLTRLLTAGAAWEDWSVAACGRYSSRFTATHFQERLLEAVLGRPSLSVAL